MPLTNEAKQQLRNFYKKVQNKKKKRTITVSRATSANNKNKLSPRRMTTKIGRPYLIWNEAKAPSGITYSIQTIRPNSRKMWNKRASAMKL